MSGVNPAKGRRNEARTLSIFDKIPFCQYLQSVSHGKKIDAFVHIPRNR